MTKSCLKMKALIQSVVFYVILSLVKLFVRRLLRLLGEELSLAVHGAFGQSGDLVLEQLLGLLPDTDVLPVLETEQTREQVCAEGLGCLAGQQTGQVVDADNAQRQIVAALGESHGHCGLAESGVDVVNGNGVVGVGGVAGDVADDTQAARLSGQRLGVDERRNLGREVDAVDEDVRLNDLLVRARPSGGLLDVPLDDVFEARADAEVDGTTAAATESTNDEDARVVAGLRLAFFDSLLHIIDEEVLVLVAGDTGKGLVLAVLELPRPGQECESGASEAGVVAECCNTASVLVLEEFKIKESSLALGEAAEDGVPTTLVLVAYVLLVLYMEVQKILTWRNEQ